MHLGSQDKIVIDEKKKEVLVQDEYGISILYEATLHDMLALEEELIKIGTFYLNEHEFINDSAQIEPLSAIDRGEMTHDLLSLESSYAFEKVLFVQTLMDAFEHICDPIE